MFIVNGMMAKQFAKYEHNNDVLIFACGVIMIITMVLMAIIVFHYQF